MEGRTVTMARVNKKKKHAYDLASDDASMMSFEEIAKKLGLSVVSVTNTYYRAIQKLKRVAGKLK